jgi:hypothetical protein
MSYSSSIVIFNVVQSYFNLFTYKPQIGAGILKSIFCFAVAGPVLDHFVKTFLTKLSDSAAHPSCTQIFQNMKGDVTGLVAFVSLLENFWHISILY